VKFFRFKYFSLILDESTDSSGEQQLVIGIRFWNWEIESVITSYLRIQSTSGYGSSGEGLFKIIMECLNKYELELNNVVGVATDGGSNVRFGVRKKVTEIVSDLVQVWCPCHRLNLVGEKTIELSDFHCIHVAKNIIDRISVFFRGSIRRQKILLSAQESLLYKRTHKMPASSNTRWSANAIVADFICSHFDAICYALDEITKEGCKKDAECAL
jgi:hypothetical protein